MMENKTSQALLHINLLGTPEVCFENGTPLQIPKKLLALLAHIAIEKKAVQRAKLILLFWSDVTDDLARSSLRTGLSELKKILGEYIKPSRHTVSLDWEKPIQVDALELEAALGKELIDLEKLDQAITSYRGNFLAGLEIKDAPEFDDWCLSQQEHYQQIAFEAFDKLIGSEEDKKDYSSALKYAQGMLSLDQLREESHYKLIYLQAKQGNRAAALQQYEKCRQILAENLAIEPSEAIENLIAQIKSGELGQLSQSSAVHIPATEISNIPSSLPTNLTPPAFLAEEESSVRETLFVGRKAELDQLHKALRLVGENKGQVRLVLGNAGQGKSYLLQQFTDKALEANPELLVLTGYCDQQSGIGDPYLPFRHILLLLLGDVEAQWHGGLISTGHAKRLWEAMGETVPQIAKYAPDLITNFLIDAPLIERLVVAGLEKEPWFDKVVNLTSEKPLGALEQTKIISLYVSALQAIAKIRPVLLILEDTHWIDSSSAALFNYLSRHVARNRILLIGSYRSSDVSISESHPMLEISRELHRLYGAIDINLEDQKVDDEREFVNAYLDSEANELDSNFREVFFKHTQGHALFTAELLSAMKDRGDLYQQGGKWLAKDTIDWHTLPAKVEGVIEVRIGHLPNEQRELLSVASVQGEAFIGEAVAQVQKQDEREVIRAFSNEIDKRHRLVQSERMERLGKQRLSHYRFRHNLFQQYVYSNLAETERTYLHEDIAFILEDIYGEKAKDIAPQLAWHFEQAGNIEKTLEYLLVAGQQAQTLGSNKEAIAHYERGLALINQLPKAAELTSIELGFQAGLGMALLPVEGNQSARVRVALERALELCHQAGETNPQLITAYEDLTHHTASSSNLSLQTCLDWSSELKAIPDKQKELAHLATADTLLISAYFFLGHNDKVVELGYSFLSEGNVDESNNKNMICHYTHDQRVILVPILSWALCFKGKLKEAKTLITKEPLPDYRNAAGRAMFLALSVPSYQFMHDFTSLKAMTDELLKLANEKGYSFWESWGLVSHGWARAQLGEVEAGIVEIQQGLNAVKVSGGLPITSYLLAMLAEGLMLKYEYNKALNVLEEAFEHSKKKGEFFYLSQLNQLKGKCLQKLGAETTEVEQYFRQAMVVAKKQGACMLELQATLSLAKYWQAKGKLEKAHSLLKELLERITPIVDIGNIPEHVEAQEMLAGLA